MYSSKEREVTLSEDLHGLVRALALRKPDKIARAAIKHPQVVSCLLQNMSKIVNRACEAVSRPSSRSLFRDSSYEAMLSFTISRTAQDLQTHTPTLWKLLRAAAISHDSSMM